MEDKNTNNSVDIQQTHLFASFTNRFVECRVMLNYPQRLKKAREHAKLSQEQLAERVGIKQQSIGYLEDPKKAAKGSRYTPRLADECGVSALWLATGEGEMVPSRAEQPSAGYDSLTNDAREVAIAWSKLSAQSRAVFRELLFVHAVLDNRFPWLRRGRPQSQGYAAWEKNQVENMELMIGLAADRRIAKQK